MQTSEHIDALTESYRPILYGNYDLVDRIVLNGYIKIMHGAGGFRLWWHNMYGHHKDLDDNHLMRFAGRFSRRVYWPSAVYLIESAASLPDEKANCRL